MKYLIPLALAIALIAGCSSSAPALTAHGTITDNSALYGQPDCVSSGDQVVVTNSSGTVLATASLRENEAAERKLDSSAAVLQLVALARLDTNGETQLPVAAVGFYDFTVTVPDGQARYGVRVGQHPVYYVSGKDMARGPALSCGGS